jgi:2-polyprenyl-3-methyl-5-hydroxy-6-metoxy-1,4-benzoquinol methylase
MPQFENCVICGKPCMERFIEAISDDRFGCPDVVSIYKCQSCNHFACFPRLEEHQISSLYEKYYGRTSSAEIGEHRTLHSKFWRWIMGENNLGQFAIKGRGVKMLDVGSGDCQNLWDATYLGFNAYGFDVDRTSVQIGKLNGLRVKSGESAADAYFGEKFDYIQLNQVIEHFRDPAVELEGLAEMLAENGLIFISTPNSSSILRYLCGKTWINWHVPYHQHHFSKKSLRKLMEDNNWIITKSRTVTPLVWVSLQLRNSRRSQQAGAPSKVWATTTQRKYSRLLELTVIAAVFFPIRILDLIKLGDCQMVIARRKN